MSSTALQWVVGRDTGASSIAIWGHMMGAGSDGSSPLDPDDFGRCYRLLERVPEWKPRIAEMGQYSAAWTGLAGAWDELTSLYEREIGTGVDREKHWGSAPLLYERMKIVRGDRY